tara:strand:+ start:3956 stop:4261 length:306 start_codon:yes stop_codon:yes gene_type:complete
MERYQNITNTNGTTTVVTLVERGDEGFVDKVSISNNGDNEATHISLNLYDDTNVYYLCQNIVIPKGVVFVLEDIGGYDTNTFTLRMSQGGSANQDLTVIIE